MVFVSSTIAILSADAGCCRFTPLPAPAPLALPTRRQSKPKQRPDQQRQQRVGDPGAAARHIGLDDAAEQQQQHRPRRSRARAEGPRASTARSARHRGRISRSSLAGRYRSAPAPARGTAPIRNRGRPGSGERQPAASIMITAAEGDRDQRHASRHETQQREPEEIGDRRAEHAARLSLASMTTISPPKISAAIEQRWRGRTERLPKSVSAR